MRDKSVHALSALIHCGRYVMVDLEGEREPHLYPAEFVVVEVRHDGREGTALVVGDEYGMKAASYPAVKVFTDPKNPNILVGLHPRTGNWSVRTLPRLREFRRFRKRRRK